MPNKCKVCETLISRTANRVKCAQCANLCHTTCIVTDDKDECSDWQCADCSEEDKEPSLSDVMKMLKIIREEQKDACNSIESCHSRMDEMNGLLKQKEKLITECSASLEALNGKYNHLQQENADLKQKINDLEQYSRINCVEIFGVPETGNENVITTVQSVANAVGFNLNVQMIDACHRLGRPSTNKTQPRGIIAKFVRRMDKKEFLRCRKIKRDLKLADISSDLVKIIKNNNSVYINESLTVSNRQLFAKAREYKKQNNLKYLWIRNGKMYMRAKDDSKVFEIKNVSDFADVH